MSSFNPLNVIFEEESEEEIDDSKEIQIEEALKLYQNALRLHSQGPTCFEEAEQAYKELFQSEIFTYPESLSETKWLELYGDTEVEDDIEDDLAPEVSGLTTGSDGTPSTLPQILYLAYKNYGQFRLDRLRHKLIHIEQDLLTNSPPLARDEIFGAASIGLDQLVEALGRDETDLELWRRVSRVSEFLGSRRIARYCLEAVLDTGDVGTTEHTNTFGLEESFAAEQLKSLLPLIQDYLSEARLLANPFQVKSLTGPLKKLVDPCPYLPKTSVRLLAEVNDLDAQKVEILVPVRSWAAVGKAILIRIQQETKGIVNPDPGASYFLTIPPKHKDLPSNGAPMDPKTFAPVLQAPNGAAVSTRNKPRHEQSSIEAGARPAQESLTAMILQPHDQAVLSPTEDGARTDKELMGLDMHSKKAETDANGEMGNQPPEGSSTLPTRKRSSDSAELPDPNDTVRSRSKRIKARCSTTDPTLTREETAEDWAKWFDQQLHIYVKADDLAFQSADSILNKLHCRLLGPPLNLKEAMYQQQQTLTEPPGGQLPQTDFISIRALKQLLDAWDLPKSRAFLNGGGLQDPAKGSQVLGFSTFLEQSMRETQSVAERTGLPDDLELDRFAQRTQQMPPEGVNQLATQWLFYILLGQAFPPSGNVALSLYQGFLWPDALKETIVQMLVQQDEVIFSAMDEVVERYSTLEAGAELYYARDEAANFVQTVFELHLDVYGRITNPSSVVDMATRTLQRDRLCRWAALASRSMNQASWLDTTVTGGKAAMTHVYVRFLWSTVVCNNLLDPSSGEHTVACYHDIIRLLRSEANNLGVDAIVISLINNAVIPEVSVSAAEREISRLTTMDFFTNIFSSDGEDPFAVVDHLEPLLTLSVARPKSAANFESQVSQHEKSNGSGVSGRTVSDPTLFEALQFLNRASLSLRLFLWQKLRDAYSVINYPAQILSCNLRSFALIVQHLNSSFYINLMSDNDSESFLHWLHKVDDLMSQILALILTDANAFDCIDHDHILCLMDTVVILLRTLHVFALWEDSIRVGQSQPPIQLSSTANKAQIRSAEKFREMIVKTWTLQYLVFREATVQNQSVFQMSSDDLLNYLKFVHYALGLRTYCGLANRIFLKLAKSEMLRMKPQEGWDIDMPQIVFDLYGLKISSTVSDVQEHACESSEIDRATALEILDLVMLHVNRMSIKELMKSDLKFAVDKLQQVIKIPKLSINTAARQFNKRLVNSYLKSPINPVELFRSLRGVGGLSSTPARTEGFQIARRGWYFLLGHISLTKFRSQKRISAGSTDDLEHAKVFFKHDLEFDTERWETWYRLAQAYDTTLEEYTTWTADKLDNDMAALVELQRQAILCYTMAVAVAARSADASFETTSKMADLYSDFGTRIYASTREPFSMKAFSLQDYEKPYNDAMRGMYRSQPFRALHLYPAWKFASALLRQASLQKPNDWATFYMFGKVLWKMHNCSVETLGRVERTRYRPVVDAFVRAIECVPDKRDSRHPEKDPILEPHYKLLSIVHKLVQARRCSAEQGCHILKATHYSRRVPDIQESEEWVDYMQEVLKALRSADKANWHHRMVARAAHTIYETDPDDLRTWLGAKHELTQQIFTKTMTIQVWKPDNERAGRHFVYTGRYVSFFVQILFKLKDKDSLEALARRIRKRGGDFVNHAGIWQELSFAYLTFLRDRVKVQAGFDFHPGFEELVFRTKSPEDFAANAGRLESWIQSPATTCVHLDTLRDAIEFKKLNNGLLKTSIIEELIGDIYALIYESHAENLKAKETAEENRVRMRVDNILAGPVPHISNLELSSAVRADQQAVDPMAIYKRRPTTITHREIIRKAEALMVKPPPIATPKPAVRTLTSMGEPGKSPSIAVVIPSQSSPKDVISVPGSPGSVHDSADDESELSDVEDERAEEESKEDESRKAQAKAPLFPNLFSAKNNELRGGDGLREPNGVPLEAGDGEGEPATRDASAKAEAS
ncbi:MAG: hypothetical protein Q9217_001484 [Psora testacea]